MDRYYLILSKDIGYGNTLQLMSQLEEVSKLLEVKWTPSQGQFFSKLRCASFCFLIKLFMLPFEQLSLPNTPQQVFP